MRTSNSRTASRLSASALLPLLVSSVMLSSCGPGKEGMILLVNKGFRAQVIGSTENGFEAPDGILWRDGKFYLADEGGSAFRVWDPSGRVQTLVDSRSGISSPEDLVMDAGGTIFFTDDDVGGVWSIDPRGRTALLAGRKQGIGSTEGIALAPSGAIIVGDASGHRVLRVDRLGTVTTLLGPEHGIKKPESMVFDEGGNLYIADNEDNILYMLAPDGKLRRLIENRPNFSPETIWYARGVLYITDRQNSKLFRYSHQNGLETIAAFAGRLAPVSGVTTDPAGNIYLSVQTSLSTKQGYILRFQEQAKTPKISPTAG